MFHFFKLRKIETHLNESLKETINHPNETEALTLEVWCVASWICLQIFYLLTLDVFHQQRNSGSGLRT